LVKVRDLLERKKLFIFDVEGVLCDSIDRPLARDRAADLLLRLREAGKRVLVITNISRKSSAYVIERLKSIGMDLEADQILTAGKATAAYILERYPGARCFVISEGGLAEDLVRSAISIVTEEPVNVVAVGANRRMTYSELNFAARLVLRGAELICAGTSATFKGSFLGDEGIFVGEAAITEAIKYATGRPATYIGKPYPEIFQKALDLNAVRAAEAVMFGDSLKSDVVGAKGVGITAVYVSKEPPPRTTPDAEMPDLVIRDLTEFYEAAFR